MMTEGPPDESGRARKRPSGAGAISITLVAALQLVCGAFFVFDLASTIFGWRTTPISWSLREAIEIMATLGLILGMVLGGLLIRTLSVAVIVLALAALPAAADFETGISYYKSGKYLEAAGEFQALVAERFDDWGLTPSERDVALFMLKGFSNAEIAALRETSEGTIKAQSTAVFRKAGVTGRAQLLSGFIEDVMSVGDER